MRPPRLALLLLLLLTPPALAGPWSFEGQVIEADGRPIAGATVRAYRNVDRGGFLPPSSEAAAVGTTDVTGRYVLRADELEGGPAVRTMVIVVDTPDRARREQWIERAVLDEGERIRIHPVALWSHEDRRPPAPGLEEAPWSVLQVRVLRGGRPVRDLPVRGLADGRLVGEGVSGSDGCCELSLPVAANSVRVEDTRYAPRPAEPHWSFVVPRGAGAERVVELPPLDATVRGKVAFVPAQEPEIRLSAELVFTAEVAGGTLTVRRGLPSMGPYELPLPTGARGTLRLSPWARQGFCGNDDTPCVAFDLRRPVEAGQTVGFEVPCGLVHGRVLGPTGLERGLVQVEATLADGRALAFETNHHGEFFLRGVPPGVVRIAARDGLDRGDTTLLMTPGARVEAVVHTP